MSDGARLRAPSEPVGDRKRGEGGSKGEESLHSLLQESVLSIYVCIVVGEALVSRWVYSYLGWRPPPGGLHTRPLESDIQAPCWGGEGGRWGLDRVQAGGLRSSGDRVPPGLREGGSNE